MPCPHNNNVSSLWGFFFFWIFNYFVFFIINGPMVAQMVKKKKMACHVGDPDSIPGLGRFPWRREWLLTPVFLPGQSHGQRSLAGCNL